MPPLKDTMPLVKEPHIPPRAPLPWILPSLFAAFNVVMLVVFSALFFAFPCRWLAQNGEWAFPTITGPLFVLTFLSLISLNFSDPGILHQGSNEQGPMTVHMVWVNHRAFRLQWCQKCCFHRPPRTYHCPLCNICVEPLSIDKVIAIVVAVPAAGFLVPLFLLLLIQATSVSAAERSCEGKGRYLRGYNPFDHGCASNWYLTICAPLGPKYMAKAVLLQRVVEPDWVLMQNLHSPTCPAALCPSVLPGPGSGHQPQPLARHKPGNAPPGSGEAAALQELHAGPVLPLPWEAPR
uniref:Zinc finger DHHC-type palmitoyltransferase 19 n=1 Tax=Molossus molossus TaxID=27622 RepID=A0A7J8I2R9_MOLMO|nr:zinc finger DHHC-type palmitoyltransferase 19 [Molossus molossus]